MLQEPPVLADSIEVTPRAMATPIVRSRMILTNAVLILILLVYTRSDKLAGGSQRKKPEASTKVHPFRVNFKLPFYKGKFYPCKGTRDLNPVEAVRARSWATQIFTRCGSKVIVYYASRFQVPAYAIQAVGDRICLGATLAYALRSIDNGTVISDVTTKQPGVLLEPVEMLLEAMIKLNYTKLVTQGKRRYYIHAKCFIEFLHTVLQCALERATIPADLDYVKHIVNYYRFIVL